MAEPGTSGSSCRLEFAVQMRCRSCADAVRAALEGAPGVRLLELRPEAQSVLVEATVGAERVRELLERSGRRAVLKGMGGSEDGECGFGALEGGTREGGGLGADGSPPNSEPGGGGGRALRPRRRAGSGAVPAGLPHAVPGGWRRPWAPAGPPRAPRP
uniref:HMA domain-containing protein n=1 Tax=Amazona collaria TaxID=241587 RepID=A0A8B9G344_9PSIT